jgi:PhnB protein
MRVNVHVCYQGDCEAAFAHYRAVLGGDLVACLRWRDAPAEGCGEMPAGWSEKVMHACLDLGGMSLMGCDAPPARFEKPAGFSVQVAPETVEECQRIFAALGEGGTVSMPLEPTFWSAAFGILTDRFGIGWMVNCAQPAATAGAAAA